MGSRKSYFIVASSLALLVSFYSPASAEAPGVMRCRSAFPAEVRNPNNAGGWFFENIVGEGTLCLYGTLERIDERDLERSLSGIEVDFLVVRSTGGPVATWLSVGEFLSTQIDILQVDEVCFSSCAIYAMPLARKVVVPKGSLVIWHGGPTIGLQGLKLSPNSLTEAQDLDDLASRTEDFLKSQGIDPALLLDSALPPQQAKIDLVAAVSPDAKEISGYAFSPERLENCYGFLSVREMWHPGSDIGVLMLAKSKVSTLAALEFPSDARPCDRWEMRLFYWLRSRMHDLKLWNY